MTCDIKVRLCYVSERKFITKLLLTRIDTGLNSFECLMCLIVHRDNLSNPALYFGFTIHLKKFIMNTH